MEYPTVSSCKKVIQIVGRIFMYYRRILKEHLYLLYSYDASASELRRFFASKKLWTTEEEDT